IMISVTNELIQCLGSYSGLEQLSPNSHSGGNVGLKVAGELADLFFGKALPQHTDTLVALGFPAAYEGRWSLDHTTLMPSLGCLI
ncbi:hypothetical protein B0H13DRAFT_1669313, partial [Mycena leptocephala]